MVNDVKLTTPYIIGNNGIYIGYTVTITDASEGTTKFPIVNYSGPEPNSFLYVLQRLQQNGRIWLKKVLDS